MKNVAQRKCSVCRIAGHTRQYCPQWRVPCEACGLIVPLDKNGVMVDHVDRAKRPCVAGPVSDPEPSPYDIEASLAVLGMSVSAPTVESVDDNEMFEDPTGTERQAPVIRASFASECDTCYGSIYEGDEIRADGEGGWECARHAEEERVHDAPDPAKPLPEDEFEDPTPRTEYKNASGQPKERVVRGKYQITDPVTGEYRRFKTSGNIDGFSRCTNFIKAPTDTTGLTDWKMVNVLVGAAKRPDVAAKAWGKTWHNDMRELQGIVEELEEIAGAKVSAGVGSDLHEHTERLDAGQISLDDVPPVYRDLCAKYLQALRDHGLVPVAGLIERTTMTHRYGGVAGSFDRIYLHEPTGTYVIADTKTGKDPDKYGRQEIPAQLFIYRTGYMENGTYDWNTETWEPPAVTLREDFGFIIHMPVDGPKAWTVTILRADLRVGREWSELCERVRTERTGAPKFEIWDGTLEGTGTVPQADLDEPDAEGLKPLVWDNAFASVRSNADATAVWEMAKAEGISGPELKRLIGIAKQALRRVSSVDTESAGT